MTIPSQDATRCVRLLNLPTVLNLQLNRFIFDMHTGRKKKLNSYVQFPEELDMSGYVNKPSGSQVTWSQIVWPNLFYPWHGDLLYFLRFKKVGTLCHNLR